MEIGVLFQFPNVFPTFQFVHLESGVRHASYFCFCKQGLVTRSFTSFLVGEKRERRHKKKERKRYIAHFSQFYTSNTFVFLKGRLETHRLEESACPFATLSAIPEVTNVKCNSPDLFSVC